MAEQTALKNSTSASENDTTEKYLTFFIEGQLFAIPSSQVVEIIRMQPITFIPKLPPYVIGVINLRGKIVPLLDIRLKFNKDPKEYDDHTSIIVAETGDLSIGFIVDSVNDVTNVSKNQISDTPRFARDTTNHYVKGIATLNENAVMLLDIAKILSEGEEVQLPVK
ncbi:chemotaxis protein CheW [Caproiciproducens faecalis]|uniref:Purine-binding chemotaxis protein CheW n=1 Tax=Caproiciproducens faecalis TaxID=2820301 RepID=A0ABS7DQJ1_9FIRM|nr:chemotaxis protein CheW [Caproiciproducens faecalis]MBW7573381.1 purine-binding chemotaxis protein CheW [Caproiciproducens faecalis]